MNPFVMFLLAIFSPFMLAATLLVPAYVSVAGACYLVYYNGNAAKHPLAGQLDNVFYMLDVYRKLFAKWSEHMLQADPVHYTLPLIVLPIVGCVLSFVLTAKLSRKLHDTFREGH